MHEYAGVVVEGDVDLAKPGLLACGAHAPHGVAGRDNGEVVVVDLVGAEFAKYLVGQVELGENLGADSERVQPVRRDADERATGTQHVVCSAKHFCRCLEMLPDVDSSGQVERLGLSRVDFRTMLKSELFGWELDLLVDPLVVVDVVIWVDAQVVRGNPGEERGVFDRAVARSEVDDTEVGVGAIAKLLAHRPQYFVLVHRGHTIRCGRNPINLG